MWMRYEKKFICTIFFSQSTIKFRKSGTKNALKVINENKILSNDNDNTVLQFFSVWQKGKS